MRAFLDSNILVYAFSQDARAERARTLLPGAVVGVQCLNEFVNVALKKLRLDWPVILLALDRVRRLCSIAGAIDVELHEHAIFLAERYRLAIYDALILAAAIEAGCDMLWSEDMHDSLVIDGRITVRNPFSGLG